MLLAAVVCLAGCPTAPPIEEAPEEDNPPEVDWRLVEPPAGTSVTLLLSDQPTPIKEFTVEGAVSDADGDQLFYYWYLLYAEEETNAAPARTLRTFTYQPCQLTSHPPPLAEDPALMYLQLDISDRARLQRSDGGELDEPRTYPADANVVTLSWLLVLRGTCPPPE